MIDRYGIAVTGLAVGLAISTGCGRPSEAMSEVPRVEDARPPNIVWIVSDRLSAPFTGHVAALAGAGVSFTNATWGAAASASERSALLTGVRPASLGLDDGLSAPLPAGVAVLPLELRKAGYYTSRAGPARHNLLVGVADDPRGNDVGPPGLLGAWDAAGDEADWRGRLVDWDFPCTVSFGCGGAGVDRARPFFALFNLSAADSGSPDHEIGTILEALDADGLAEETVVFVLGFDPKRRVVIVRRPGQVDAGATRDEPVNVIDLAPTTLVLAGVSVPVYMTGRVLFGSAVPATPNEDHLVVADAQTPGWSAPTDDVGLPRAVATPSGYPTGGLFHVAPRVELSCDTEDSTLVYTTEREAPFYWRLYTGPFRMRLWTLRFQCGRLGYRDSEVVTYDFDIE